MAGKTSRKTKASSNRETAKSDARAHEESRKDEPAAAPLETDAEAGSQSSGSVPPTEAGNKGSADTDAHEHEDAPWVQDTPRQHQPRLSQSLVLGVVVIAIALLIVVAVI